LIAKLTSDNDVQPAKSALVKVIVCEIEFPPTFPPVVFDLVTCPKLKKKVHINVKMINVVFMLFDFNSVL